MSSSVAGKTAVLQNIHGTMEFLRKYPPFNQMDSAQLAYLVEHCQLRFYAAGESIIKPGDGPVQHFYIVKQGLVVGERPHSARRGSETTFEIASGECFPLAALLGERATRTEHLAGEDTFCLLLGKDAFVRLFAQSAPFRDFALRGVSSLLDQVNQQVQLRAAENLGAQYSLDTTLRELALQQPVTCSAATPLRDAVRRMHEQHVGSIVIVDEDERARLKGIVSERRKYQFFHESDLKLNEMYQYSRECFRGELDFLAYSQRVAKHLYARSQHPNISAGDVFVIEFAGLHDGEREMRALGIFKSEIRDDFLTLTESGQEFAIGHASGINPRLIDKGALVLEYGPYAYAVDRLGQQAKFWTEDFLQAKTKTNRQGCCQPL